MIDELDGRDGLIDRAARALAELPPVDPLATARIITSVRARRAHRSSVWRRAVWPAAWRATAWTRDRSVSVRAASLLVAASLVLGFLVRGVTPWGAEDTGAAGNVPMPGGVSNVPVVPAATNSREPAAVPVPFVFETRNATSVAVVGDFNGWDPAATPMQRFGADGPWTATVLIRPGRHTYAFLVDGSTLVADPRAPRTRSADYGGDASVLMVRTP